MFRSTLLIRLLFIAAILAVLPISCSKTPDVRLTLCQDLTKLLLNTSDTLEWVEHKAIIKGFEDLEMQIQFAETGSNGQTSNTQVSCFYQYEQDEIEAETFNTPTAAYSTYPSKMILDGQVVAQQHLFKSINQVMLLQGKEAIHKVKQGMGKASKKVAETLKE